jgi:hypothetical protein
MSRLPARLERLKKVSTAWGPFAGDFQFEREGAAKALAWCNGKRRLASAFRVFGGEGDGGLYALWLEAGSKAAVAPVVYLGSEGEARVLASTVSEFLSLLALDLRELGLFEDLGTEGPSRTRGHRSFVSWLKTEGLEPASNPERVVAAARLAHPGLASFVSGSPLTKKRAERPAASRELPAEPTTLLGRPRPDLQLTATSGLQLVVGDDGLVQTVFLKPCGIGATLRPLGLELFSMTRPEVLRKLGERSRSGKSWDRFDRNPCALHVQYGNSGEVVLVTLMWMPNLPMHLR